jgi:hypothetical protein
MPTGCPVCGNQFASLRPLRDALGRVTQVDVECPACGVGLHFTLEAINVLDLGLFTAEQFKRLQSTIRAMSPLQRAKVIDAGQLERLCRSGTAAL